MDSNFIETSLGRFGKIVNFKRFFDEVRESLEKEQKDLIFKRKGRQEEKEYFNFMKFILTAPK
ncbi:MAG TPA: hypothetical protein VES68_01455 [Candidatus Sulfotelmatobacter sp.]|nr:hypothetical protein [Candidatus Sulfotelmatobacter sp.]